MRSAKNDEAEKIRQFKAHEAEGGDSKAQQEVEEVVLRSLKLQLETLEKEEQQAVA